MLQKIPGPDREGREAMYYADRQEVAYRRGAYDYLHSIAMVPRLATIAAYVKAFGLTTVLDVGYGTADLLAYLDPDVTYVGVDIAPTPIGIARERFADRRNTFSYAEDFQRVKFDFDHFGRQVRVCGLILLHDSSQEGRGFTPWEVKRFLHAEVFGRAQYESFTLPFAAGLTLVRKLK